MKSQIQNQRKPASVIYRYVEFFEADNSQRLSMSRLLMFLAFPIASVVVIIDALKNENSDALGWYLGAFVFNYVGGKFADAQAIQKPPVVVNQSGDGDTKVEKD